MTRRAGEDCVIRVFDDSREKPLGLLLSAAAGYVALDSYKPTALVACAVS